MQYSIDGRGVFVSFPNKPTPDVIGCLKRNGFRWDPMGKSWYRRKVTGSADILGALDKMINPREFDGDCWECGKPGKFRAFGAATPVLCDECHVVRERVAR